MNIRQTFLLSLLPICLSLGACQQQAPEEVSALTAQVNPFTGTDGPGNTYPGATVPFGMVQLSPDNGYSGWDRIAGYYWPDSTIAGFSHTHLTGTGAGDLYDILVMPLNDRSQRTVREGKEQRPCSLFSHNQEEASPGYYRVELLDYDIRAELTATRRVGMHRYTFPEGENARILINLGYALNWDGPVDTYMRMEDDRTLVGYRKSSGWAADQRVYFVARFSKPVRDYQLMDFSAGDDKVSVRNEVKGRKTKGLFFFDTKQEEPIMVKVALSSASIEGARRNLQAELSDKQWDFGHVRDQAAKAWEEQLGKVRLKGADPEQARVFYTAMYQSMLAPTLFSDTDGAYKGADGQVQEAKGFERYDTFSLWDTFRAAHPLYTLIHTQRASDMVRSLLAHYRETGLLPVWSLAGNETNMMIGYHAVPVIVDAYLKGIGSFDVQEAYEACKTSAMTDGREIDEYKRLGFVPLSDGHENWSVSKTLEYAYGDWCVAQFAKALGKLQDYDYFMARSANWRKHFDAESRFMRPRHADGRFLSPFDPKEYTDHFCESNAWHYYWFVPQDIPGLIEATGGAKAFEAKLDSMFSLNPLPTDKLPIFSTGMIGQYAHGNEPSHHVAYLYNYVDQPRKAQQMVRRILQTQYKATPDGICGNEDCGQMSAWYILSSLGFYPVNPADGTYQLGAPIFPEAELQLGNDKSLRILAQGLSDTHTYVRRVLLNGKPLDRTFVTHQELMAGGTLTFEMCE